MSSLLTLLAVIPFLAGIFYRVVYPPLTVYNDFKKAVLSLTSLSVLGGMLIVFTFLTFAEGKVGEGVSRGIITALFFYFYKDEFMIDAFHLLNRWGAKGGLTVFFLFCIEVFLFSKTVSFFD